MCNLITIPIDCMWQKCTGANLKFPPRMYCTVVQFATMKSMKIKLPLFPINNYVTERYLRMINLLTDDILTVQIN